MFSYDPNLVDLLLSEFDISLKVLYGISKSSRPNPSWEHKFPESLSHEEQSCSIRLMRVNHVGEVCAQALYRGQALVCKQQNAKKLLMKSADEELDHLTWCYQRIKELEGHSSLLNPFWYFASFTIGIAAGLAGTPYNLGFVVETEKQVELHIEKHLEKLPKNDERSRKILMKMKEDEKGHGENARNAGGVDLPVCVKWIMFLTSRIMINLSYKL